MDYIKLFRQYNGEQSACAQIYTRCYAHSLDYIMQLSAELKKDFPEIKDEDIGVQKYGGIRKKGMTFVEVFFEDHTEIPADYDEVKEIEYIL